MRPSSPQYCLSLVVARAGSFTHWQKMPMQWRQVGAVGEWYKTVDLPPATHQYKFIIDGQWRHDHTAPTVLDNLGNVNNCITVQAAPPSAAGSSAAAAATPSAGSGGKQRAVGELTEVISGATNDPRGQDGSDGRKVDVSRVTSDPYNLAGNFPNDSYSQVVPPRDELLVHHSASLLLPPQLRLLLPHHHGDATTMPLSVQMNHVFCHVDQVRAVGTATTAAPPQWAAAAAAISRLPQPDLSA